MDRLQVVRVVNRFNRHSESLDGHRFVDTWRSTLFFCFGGFGRQDLGLVRCATTQAQKMIERATVFVWIIQWCIRELKSICYPTAQGAYRTAHFEWLVFRYFAPDL